MNRQEEIKEVLNTLCAVARARDLSKSPAGFDDDVDNALLELKELGVAIRVDRELPKIDPHQYESPSDFEMGRDYMIDAGYVAVESLIK